MSESNKGNDLVFEKYYPQHPLPNEIKQLPAKDTICQFCGISYLIHSEIKRLEEEILLLNKKIKYFEELEINEKQFEKLYNDKSKDIEQLQTNYSCLNEKFNETRSERDCYHEQIVCKDDNIAKLESSLSIFKIDRDKFINTQHLFIRNIFELQTQVRNLKEKFLINKKEIVSLLFNNQTENGVFTSKIKTNVDKIQHCLSRDQQQYQEQHKKWSFDLAALQRDIDEKDRQITENIIKQQSAIDKNRILIHENNEMEHKIGDQTSSLVQKDEIIQLLKSEIDQLRSTKSQQICDTNNEVSMLRSDKRQLLQSLEELKISNEGFQGTITDYEDDIKRLNLLIQENERQLVTFKDVLARDEDHIKNLAEQMKSLTNDRNKEVVHYKTELSKLESELKSKEKLAEISIQELEKSCNTRMTQREQEIAQLSVRDEMLQKRLSEENRTKEILQKQTKSLDNENKVLVQKLEALQKHIEKKSAKSEEEYNSIQLLEKEIVDKENLIDKMEEDLISKNNEITILKQMVQKECEERSELTEALNQAREQLLSMGDYHVTKVPTTLPPINHTTSTASSASDKQSRANTIREKRNSIDKLSGGSKNSIISTKRKLERLFNT